MSQLEIEVNEKDTRIIQQALTNQFDMENDMFHDNAWLDVENFRGMAAKNDQALQQDINNMRNVYSANLDRLLALQRFIIILENR